jgi:hypothetical protein
VPITGLLSAQPDATAQAYIADSARRAAAAVALPRSRAMAETRAATSARVTSASGLACSGLNASPTK